MPQGSKRALKAALVLVLVVGSFVWTAILLGGAWADAAGRLDELDIRFVALSMVLQVASSLLMFAAFARMSRVTGLTKLSSWRLAHGYYVAQMMKHLPGRIWGFGYQWKASGKAGSLAGWLFLNIVYMGLNLAFAMWTAAVVMAAKHDGAAAALGVISAAVLMYVLGWRLCSSPRLLTNLGSRPGRIGQFVRRIADLVTPLRSQAIGIFGWLSAGWAMQYTAWWCYGAAYPTLGGTAGVLLCADYMLAWVAGYLSIVTPSGLGVRELAFVWLAKDYPATAVALMAVLGRVGMLWVDTFLGLAFLPFVRRQSPGEAG